MTTKKAHSKSSSSQDIVIAAMTWYSLLDKFNKHLSKRPFDDKGKEATWVTKYNKLQQETGAAGRALFAICENAK